MKFFALLLIFLSNICFSNICVELPAFETSEYSFNDDIEVRVDDDADIHANIFIPKKNLKKFPAIIFVNSWMLEEHEYFSQAKLLAKAGYIVFSYSTRGWGCSTGKVDVIGPRDIKDLSQVMDYLISTYPVDSKNIGMSGISYGGGMSLMAAALEPRIKTVAAMSAWGSLTDAVYEKNTARQFWATTLIATGAALGEIDTKLLGLFKSLFTHEQTEAAIAWAELRSPIKYIDKVNKANKPIYIANNFGDNLFQANNIIRYFNKLTTPKNLDLNQGTHASAELVGMPSASSFVFKRMRRWFDYWLKNIRSDFFRLNEVSMQIDLEKRREYHSANTIFKKRELKLYMHPRSSLFNGKLRQDEFEGENTDVIFSGKDTRAKSGVPILSAIIDGHFQVPVYSSMPWIQRANGVFYKSFKFKTGARIRGIPKLRLTTNSAGKHYHLMAYLYDRTPLGLTKLITHGAATSVHHDGGLERFEIDLVATAYDLPPGHSLVLALDTQDLLYAKPLGVIPYRTTIHFGNNFINELLVPIL